eukprot:18387-Heterococcus_DN1.PRE.1
MASSKRVCLGAASPLEDAGILLHMLNILGPGHHLYIAAVSRAWSDSYAMVASAQTTSRTSHYVEDIVVLTLDPQTTLTSASFASASRLNLAHEYYDLAFDDKDVQRIAGQAADVATLQVAHGLGLPWSSEVLIGAAESGSRSKLHWLHREQGCELPADISYHAARSGSLDLLTWLQDNDNEFTAKTCEGAAAGAHVHLLQYLCSEGCVGDEEACSAAVMFGHLTTLQWLHEHACPWDAESICEDAVVSGNIEMLAYLKQQGCEHSAGTLHSAAVQGHLAVCQFLIAEHCPLSSASTCAEAATEGHFEIVRLLHESGCPWQAVHVCSSAARYGSVEMLQYLRQQGHVFDTVTLCITARAGHIPALDFFLSLTPALPAAQLTEMLSAAGSCHRLAAAQ